MTSPSVAYSRRPRRHWLPMAVQRLAAPPNFSAFASALQPWLLGLGLVLFATGAVWGLAFAPPDYQQGDSFRIIYVHVPAAAFAMGVYVAMALAGAVYLVWHTKVSAMVAKSCAPVGAVLTFLALATGALWGQPMWGTWWVWDARLTSTLILLFLYLGYMALHEAIETRETAAKASALLALVGVVNIPIIKFSVDWWYTLHQGATVLKLGRPAMASEMLWPLLVMFAAFACLTGFAILARARNELLARRLDPL